LLKPTDFITSQQVHIIQEQMDKQNAQYAQLKNLLKNAKDPYMALLSYHATPLAWCGLIPAELLLGLQDQNRCTSTKELLHSKMDTHTKSKRVT